MKLYEEFRLYETLWEEPLTEAKADTQKLVDFAGQELADRFLAIKSKLKAPENDLYYWIKNKSVLELKLAIIAAEQSKSKTRLKKDIADDGAELVADTPHWKIYHITSFEASQKYGRDTTWCITGVDDYGDAYWKKYTNQGINFYFLITKGSYNPRGTDCKFAIAHYPSDVGLDNLLTNYEVYNQIDELVNGIEQIPYWEEIKIPGVDLYRKVVIKCINCKKVLEPGEEIKTQEDLYYCKDCFDKECFICASCGKVAYKDLCFDDLGKLYCLSCERKMPPPNVVKGCLYTVKHKAFQPSIWTSGRVNSPDQLVAKLEQYCKDNPELQLSITVISNLSGEILIDLEGKASTLSSEIKTQVDNILPFYWTDSYNLDDLE